MTVVVDNGVVTEVGTCGGTKIPANAETIDGTGKTLIPGLWDNHQHYGDDSTGPCCSPPASPACAIPATSRKS